MRFLLSIVLLLGGMGLFCHGWFLAHDADAALAAAGGSGAALEGVIHTWPYSAAAVSARETAIDRAASASAAEPAEGLVETIGARALAAFDVEQSPFVWPAAAAAIGLLALLLAIILPGTRCRGAALMGFLAGAVALFPGYAPLQTLAEWSILPGVVHALYAWFPYTALIVLGLGGLLLAGRRRD